MTCSQYDGHIILPESMEIVLPCLCIIFQTAFSEYYKNFTVRKLEIRRT